MKIQHSIVDFILANYNQNDLMAKYFKLDIKSINYCLLDVSNKVNNPLRNDAHPSLSFMYREDGKLISKDWADDTYTGDIFDIVSVLTGLSIYIPNEFVKICNYIIDNNVISNKIIDNNIKLNNIKSFTNIRFKRRALVRSDINYLTKGGININYFLQTSFAVEYVWIGNNTIPAYAYNSNDPAYVYYLGAFNNNDILQVYRPFAYNKLDKFRTNCKTVFQAEHELYHADTLIITKSRKDKFVLDSLLVDNDFTYVCDVKKVSIFHSTGYVEKDKPKYCITSFTSETMRITDKIYNILTRFYNNIIIFVDFDEEGIRNAFYHNVLYGIKCVFLGNNNDLESKFTDKRIKRMFDKILLVNPNITLYSGMVKSFINEHKNNYNEKDIFEYTTVNGVNKGEELINKLFI